MQQEFEQKKHILFVLFSADVELLKRENAPGWTPLSFLCDNAELSVARVHFFYWPKEYELMRQCMDTLKKVHDSIIFTFSELPLENLDGFDHSHEDKIAMVNFFYEWVISYKFDYNTEEYIFYFQGPHGFLRSIVFYFGTRNMIHINTIDIQPPSSLIPYPGKLIKSATNLSVYEALSEVIRTRHNISTSLLKDGIRTRNRHFNQLIEQLELVAVRSTSPILLLGPPGVGKSALAKRIFLLKTLYKNLSGAFVDVNCASIRGDSAQSMLFGHERGAFTGATTSRPGLLKAAHMGLLFLDEIASLGLEEQALLLKAIENKTFIPFGADKESSSTFQLICGTNKDLAAEVLCGRFRADLFARINMWTFTLPALARRPEDIEPNLDFELTQYFNTHNHHMVFTPAAKARFLSFATAAGTPWLGNFRDFSMAVQRMCLLADTGVIGLCHVEDEIMRLRALWKSLQTCDPDENKRYPYAEKVLGASLTAQLDSFDAVQLEEVLRACHQQESLSQAGRLLFSKSRSKRTTLNDSDRLRKFLLKYGLGWDDLKARLNERPVDDKAG